jgi:AbrB family looped-hinge helix DNA binding protein
MPLAYSRLTAQSQISVPADIRRKLGIGPGSVLEWDEQAGQILVRRAGRFTSQEIHQTLFPAQPPHAPTLAELKEGPSRYVRKRHARD